MITLPTAVTSTSSTTSTTGGVSSDSSLDGAVGGESLFGTENMPQGFLTLLGNRLLSLAQQGGTGAALSAAGAPGEMAADLATGGKATAKTSINDLLAALDKPETLSALLKPEATAANGKNGELEEDKDRALPATTLSNSDLQALQALYAMLPGNVTAPVTTGAAGEKGSDLLGNGLSKGDKQSTLNALSAALGQHARQDTEATDKTTDGAVLMPANAKGSDSSSGTGKAAVNPAAVSTDQAFQQVMNTVSKDIDKENSSSAPNATITNNVISAASTPVTPTSTTVVSAPATPLLNSQLGSPEWQQALGQQILMFSRNGQQTAELHLHPQDLGSIQISLKLDNDQAQLSMVSNHSQVRAALEAALPQLRASMAESGINLGQSNVSSDAFQQGQSFTGQQEQQRNNNGSPFSLANENDSDVTPIAVPATLQARAAGSSAVDIFA